MLKARIGLEEFLAILGTPFAEYLGGIWLKLHVLSTTVSPMQFDFLAQRLKMIKVSRYTPKWDLGGRFGGDK
eukprot:1158426-Pelagomonas_calceolata.AAC.14